MTDETAAAAASEKIETTTPPASQAGGSDSGTKQAEPGGGTGGTTAETAEQKAARERDDSGKFTKSWRDRYAGEDKDARKRLERFTDEEAWFKSYRAMEQKLRSGELKPTVPFPEKGTDEQKAEWRKEQGIPESFDKYDTAIGEGIVWGETDKPLLDDFTKWAHANNYTPDQVKANLRWYHQMQQNIAKQQEEQDAAFFQDSEDTLRAEWKNDYRRNINVMENWLNSEPSEIRTIMLAARTPDGRKLAAHPTIMKWMAQTAMSLSPEAMLTPGQGMDAKSIDAQLEELRNVMRETPDKYTSAMEQKWTDLLAQKERMQARGKAA